MAIFAICTRNVGRPDRARLVRDTVLYVDFTCNSDDSNSRSPLLKMHKQHEDAYASGRSRVEPSHCFRPWFRRSSVRRLERSSTCDLNGFGCGCWWLRGIQPQVCSSALYGFFYPLDGLAFYALCGRRKPSILLMTKVVRIASAQSTASTASHDPPCLNNDAAEEFAIDYTDHN